MFNYTDTHASRFDGSTAMQVGDIVADTITLINEDGESWSDPAEDWEAI